jgi:hypothetical protein
MFRKYSILPGIIISIILLMVAAMYYPEGSQDDNNSIGYDWKNNYQGNLLSNKVINESDDPSRLWSIGGMFFLFSPLQEFSKK